MGNNVQASVAPDVRAIPLAMQKNFQTHCSGGDSIHVVPCMPVPYMPLPSTTQATAQYRACHCRVPCKPLLVPCIPLPSAVQASAQYRVCHCPVPCTPLPSTVHATAQYRARHCPVPCTPLPRGRMHQTICGTLANSCCRNWTYGTSAQIMQCTELSPLRFAILKVP